MYGAGENFLLHSLPWLSGDTHQMDRREVHTTLIRRQLLKILGDQGRVVQSLSLLCMTLNCYGCQSLWG